MSDDTNKVLALVAEERQRQNAQWGGEEHDDGHDYYDWRKFILKQLNLTFPGDDEELERFVKIAALATAAAESIMRRREG